MPDNYVEVTVSAKDDTGPGFASADAREKAFSKLMDQTTRKEIAASSALSRTYDTQSRAAKALQAAEAAVADGERLLADHAQAAAGRQGFLRTALDGVARALDGGTGNGGLLGGLLGSAGAAEQAGTALGTMGTMIIPLIGLAATLAVALTPFIAGLGLVTVGVAAFAAGAVGEIKKVITAHQNLLAAQQAYAKATTAAGRQSALAAEKRATEGLTGSEKDLLGMLGQLQREFGKLEKAVRPEVIKGFGTALKIIRDLMPALIPLAVAAGKAIDGFLKHIDRWLNSPSGKKFIHWMEVDGPKALAVFGRWMWDTAKVIGRTFDFMYNTGKTFDHRWGIFWHDMAKVVDGFRIGFTQMGHLVEASWNATVSFIKGLIATLVGAFKSINGQVAGAFRTVFDPLKAAALSAYNFVAGIVARIEGALSGLGAAVNSALGGIPGKVLSFLGLASGGIAGAAAGGLRSGLKLVGEQGPELVSMPAGSRVYNAGQTQQMLAGAGAGAGAGGGGGSLVLEVVPGGSALFEQFMAQFLKKYVRINGGGNVQRALGRT